MVELDGLTNSVLSRILSEVNVGRLFRQWSVGILTVLLIFLKTILTQWKPQDTNH